MHPRHVLRHPRPGADEGRGLHGHSRHVFHRRIRRGVGSGGSPHAVLGARGGVLCAADVRAAEADATARPGHFRLDVPRVGDEHGGHGGARPPGGRAAGHRASPAAEDGDGAAGRGHGGDSGLAGVAGGLGGCVHGAAGGEFWEEDPGYDRGQGSDCEGVGSGRVRARVGHRRDGFGGGCVSVCGDRDGLGRGHFDASYRHSGVQVNSLGDCGGQHCLTLTTAFGQFVQNISLQKVRYVSS
mmetsp:Transcript_6981/g.17113  ORF Transcript_6981/g.17113 Transcript_6981/m.17113 type:complete len:241 (-) Transcript_6981:4132-4854(-)